MNWAVHMIWSLAECHGKRGWNQMKRQTLCGMVLLAIAAILVSCGGNAREQAVSSGVQSAVTSAPSVKTNLVVALDGEPQQLDPYAHSNQNGFVVSRLVFESLMKTDDEGNVIPWLATAWNMVDDTTLQLTLRDDVFFHDGSKLTSEDVAYSLRDALNGLSYDPNALDEIESRLFQIEQLKRKYGADIQEILAYADALRAEQTELLGGEDRMAELEQAERAAVAAFTADAQALSQRRQEAARRLKVAIEANLKDMGMPFASFSAGFTPVDPEALSENGVDEVAFRFSANKGEPEKPLVRVASGGEISRVMLSFKAALSHADAIDTLIFDEIDTGISGLIANAVARKMQELSRTHQLLCVTHLAQIAARADKQYYSYKETVGEGTRSAVKPLSEEERPAELARIMGSVNDPLAIQHARNLLRSAKES